jgi:hypothetical protein
VNAYANAHAFRRGQRGPTNILLAWQSLKEDGLMEQREDGEFEWHWPDDEETASKTSDGDTQ